MSRSAVAILLGLASVAAAQTVNLHTVRVSPGGTVVVVYGKDFNTCVHLLTPANQIMHAQNIFCATGNQRITTTTTASFNSSFVIGNPAKLCHGNNYNICSAALTIASGATLSSNSADVPLSTGGQQSLALDAGAVHAGRTYLLAGSLSGTSPGIPVGSITVPLNFDGYLLYTVTNPNLFPLTNSLGALDGAGRATAAFGLPAGFPPSLAGLVVHHAFVVLGTTGLLEASNALPVTLIP
jgi:hypothetical protein